MRTFLLATWLTAAAAVQAGTPLLLTPLIQQGKLQEARQLSKVNYEGKDLGYSAFITVPSASGKNSNNMFFWLMPCTGGCDVGTSPFTMWMQGGPGGPSTFGSLSEIGPFYADQNLDLQERCYSWCKDTSCLFIDQPAQTGFSYQLNASGEFDPKNIEYTRTSVDATKQLYEVLQQLFTVFPEFLPAPFIVTGESYGGLYTSNMAYTIEQYNTKPGNKKINLKGVSVGDPIINNKYQWPTYGNTLYGMGVIMLDERQIIDNIMQNGINALETNCTQAFQYWNSVWNDDGGGGYPGLYYQFTGSSMTEDVLLGEEPEGFTWYQDFMKKPDVAAAMHYEGIPGASFAEGGEVYHTMVNSGDFCMNSSWIFATLFLDGYDVTIYSGTVDPLLGAPTSEAGVMAIFDYAANNLASKGGAEARDAFNKVKKDIWRVDPNDVNPAGYAKCINKPGGSNRFCYVVIRNAGHESPAFQPRANYDNYFRFLEHRPYNSTGDRPSSVPEGPTCGCSGVPPFAGTALPKCHK
eukprot:TRINITY_DN1875_c1_g4_i1.p1 TRINITY_DN1875_c1_g4~~TRINITY_DN1875_c1_g4_i1.p1  ORF type:complete len:521 (+),score=189.22 TRINITY_DN1875_c1_g4_i1:44-1606(+)